MLEVHLIDIQRAVSKELKLEKCFDSRSAYRLTRNYIENLSNDGFKIVSNNRYIKTFCSKNNHKKVLRFVNEL